MYIVTHSKCFPNMFDLRHHIRMTNIYTVLCLFVDVHICTCNMSCYMYIYVCLQKGTVQFTCVLQVGKEAGYLLLVLLIFAFVYKEC